MPHAVSLDCFNHHSSRHADTTCSYWPSWIRTAISRRLSRRATVCASVLEYTSRIHRHSHVLGEPESDVPFNYARRVCSLYAQLGARGVSVLHASGDTGAGCAGFGSPFPAGCPYVTAVGGTYQIPETAASFSDGGFSDCEYSGLVTLKEQFRVRMR